MGNQVRGYGFNHDGIYDTIHRFTLGDIFNDTGFDDSGFRNDQERRDMEQYILAFDSELAPIVGQQITLNASNGWLVGERIDLLKQRAETAFASQILGGWVKECDLIVQGAGWGMLYDPTTQLFTPDRSSEAAMTDAQMRQWVIDNDEVATFSCMPFGSGERMALDRDEDGFFNQDEVAAGSDPADANSRPGPTAVDVKRMGFGRIHPSVMIFPTIVSVAITITLIRKYAR